jgi:hypothetical protein
VTYRTFEMTEDTADELYPIGWYFQRADEVRLGHVYGPYEALDRACEAAEGRP